MKRAYLTINSANYYARAMTLMDSVRRYDPEAGLHVVLAESDETCAMVAQPPKVTNWKPASLGIHELADMSFYYGITEFNTALKPFAINALFDIGYDSVVYFDPDIQVFSPMDELETLLVDYDLLLTPHIAKPVREDGLFPTVRQCIHAGQFNLGFIALRKSSQVLDFLHWWEDCLREQCLMEPDYSLFVDQLWASAAPSFIDQTKIVRSDAWNMAYWNYGHRALWWEEERWMTGDGPLFFFHYSGYDFSRPMRLSRYTEREAEVVPGSDLDRLLTGYREDIRRNEEAHPYGHIPYSFGTYRDGGTISGQARRRYHGMRPEERAALGDPFCFPERLEPQQKSLEQDMHSVGE